MDLYAVIGNPISHSKSPIIHSEFAEQTHQNLNYIKLEAPLNKFKETVDEFIKKGGKGFSVTLPFKEQACQLVNIQSPRAKIAQAVNMVTVDEDGRLFGDNTDGIGLVRDITINQNYDLAHKHLLLLGAGGAARGILQPLLQQNPERLMIANRTASKAVELANLFLEFGHVSGCGFEDLNGLQFDLIINATSASINNEIIPLPENIIAADGWCYDLMYADKPTLFLRWAIAHGAQKAIDGLGMLIEQAAEAFYSWRGIRPNTQPVLTKLRTKL